MTNEHKEQYVLPRVNIVESGEAVTIEAEMPGVSKEDVEVKVDKKELTLKGRRRANGEGERLRLRERPDASFYRSFALGDSIDTAKIDAQLRDGVLTVVLNKTESVKPRAVKIN